MSAEINWNPMKDEFNGIGNDVMNQPCCGILRKAWGFCDKGSEKTVKFTGKSLNLNAAWALLP